MAQIQVSRTARGDPVDHQMIREVDQWLVEELHDSVAQSLWYLGVELSALDQEISPHEARLGARLRTLGEVAQEAYDQVRAILGQTWSAGTSEETLDELLQRETRLFEKRTGVQIRLILGSVGLQVLPSQAHHLSAILREALCNAWRHGRVRCIRVELNAAEERISLKVTDEGAGFYPEVRQEGHYGMETMQKRAKALGGVLEVVSEAGKGTRVSLTFPLVVSEGLNQEERCSNGRSHFDCG